MIYKIEKACPLCKGDVRGNDEYKFYCKNCNMLFDKKHLISQEVRADLKAKQKQIKIPEAPLEDPEKIIASKEANKIHAGNCFFVTKIKRENRIYFKSIEEAVEKGYTLCFCLKYRKK